MNIEIFIESIINIYKRPMFQFRFNNAVVLEENNYGCRFTNQDMCLLADKSK